jgi:hypothetical protein
MTIKVSLIGIEGLINELQNIEFDLRQSTKDILVDSAKIVEKNILKELRSPNKTGTEKTGRTRFKTSFSKRRSARGESLASDSGHSETLISTDIESQNRVSVGFLKNNDGYDYTSLHEVKNNRPTLQKAFEASLSEIDNIVDQKIKIK